MYSKLKPIRVLFNISITLHTLSIVGVFLIHIFQNQIVTLGGFSMHDDVTFSPNLISTALLAIAFGFHLTLIICYSRAIKRESASLKTLSILSFIFVFIVIPLFQTSTNLLNSVHLMNLEFATVSLAMHIQTWITLATSFRALSMTPMVIATAMIFYYAFIGRYQGDSTTAPQTSEQSLGDHHNENTNPIRDEAQGDS